MRLQREAEEKRKKEAEEKARREAEERARREAEQELEEKLNKSVWQGKRRNEKKKRKELKS